MIVENLSIKSEPRLKGIILGDDPARVSLVWSERQQARLSEFVDLLPGILTSADLETHADWLAGVDVIFSSWSMPCLTDKQLAMMPNLKAVFYAAGTVKKFAPPLFERGITVVSAWAANAVPVAEFTVSQIVFALKLGWQHLREFDAIRGPAAWKALNIPGVYDDSSVGLISLGMIGRNVCKLLRPYRLRKYVCDPYVPLEEFARLGVQQMELEAIFRNCDVVSLHAPWLPETENMVTGELLASMKPNATFINTSRGALVNEAGMIEALRQRPDLTAVIDVTWPEPPVEGSPLYTMKNIVITPHIAGSMGNELNRMVDLTIEEFISWQKGEALRYAVTAELMERIA